MDLGRWFKDQKEYFTKLNKHVEEPNVVEDPLGSDDDVPVDLANAAPTKASSRSKWQEFQTECQREMEITLEKLPSSSSTAVLAAAIAALNKGLFTVPGTDGMWNARQCLGFLLHAWQVQTVVNESAASDTPIRPSVALPHERYRKCTIITGAAGTGKTALLQAQDMLTDAAFRRPHCVYRSAPTNTAARLNRGETCHAAWSLPLGSSLGYHGRLCDTGLKRLKKRLAYKQEASVDEVSMLAAERLAQMNARAQQATGHTHCCFGDLLVRLSGDFLQLPPVRRWLRNCSSFCAARCEAQDGCGRQQ